VDDLATAFTPTGRGVPASTTAGMRSRRGATDADEKSRTRSRRPAVHAFQDEGNLMKTIPPGAKGSFSLAVTPEHLANRFKDAMLPQVLATPVMIMIMENAALNALKPYLDASESAVGTRVDVRHLAATPVGRHVTGEAKVTEVDGRRITFAIQAKDGAEVVGVGTHERMVIDLAAFSERLKSKFS
jgi:fluoroacetyl-CoA thioesterase